MKTAPPKHKGTSVELRIGQRAGGSHRGGVDRGDSLD